MHCSKISDIFKFAKGPLNNFYKVGLPKNIVKSDITKIVSYVAENLLIFIDFCLFMLFGILSFLKIASVSYRKH